jgi:hypothetical protein
MARKRAASIRCFNRHCEFRIGLRPTLMDETMALTVMAGRDRFARDEGERRR